MKGVVSAVKAPIESLTSRADLLNLKAIRQLKGHPQYGAIYHLLEVSYHLYRLWFVESY